MSVRPVQGRNKTAIYAVSQDLLRSSCSLLNACCPAGVATTNGDFHSTNSIWITIGRSVPNKLQSALVTMTGPYYTIGLVCALPTELAAATAILDEEHQNLPRDANDTNIYSFGRIGKHNVVIACLPAGQVGMNSAAAVAAQMRSKFVFIRFGLMVGIGGGVPNAESDIRLGDVVVSQPYMQYGGVVQYDRGKTGTLFTRTGSLNSPPVVLLNALAKLQWNHLIGQSNLSTHPSRIVSFHPHFAPEKTRSDLLFESSYRHIEEQTCDKCSKERLVKRSPRGREEIKVHYGTIASGSPVMKDGVTRDTLSRELGGVLCFEMEAARLMNDFPCLAIRGISDYADSHKNKTWQPYTAATAAACAKDLLSLVPPAEIIKAHTMNEATVEGATQGTTIFSGSNNAQKIYQFGTRMGDGNFTLS